MLTVNGKEYPLWSQFVERKKEFIGGILTDLDCGGVETEITDIELLPNGDEFAFFIIRGKDFNCGFDVRYGGIIGGEEGWLTFSGCGNHKFRIKRPLEIKLEDASELKIRKEDVMS